MMDFVAVVDQVIALLRQRGRVAYRTLKRQFQLDDEAIEDLKIELIDAQHLARDEQGSILVWLGESGTLLAPPPPPVQHVPPPPTPEATLPPLAPMPAAPSPPEAERRQLTVLFCDLVDSTVLASQLDPEDLRAVVRAYQDTCAKVIARFEGHIAQYLGDGLLVYFGYPQAHEDDAQRAVRAGLGIVEALGPLNTRLTEDHGVHVAVRLGIHTGLVVVGEVGGGTRQEQLALGETPNLAARLQGIATPNTLVISTATFQLLGGFFACQPLGTPPLKGQTQPLAVYRVLYESMARSRLEAVGSTGWTPLVGREQESGLLRERWEQVKDGMGQVVLLSGEAGIGKSRLVQVLKDLVATEPQAWLTPCQCSPYYQHSALYPMIDLLERVVLRFEREESPPQKLSKLEGFLVQYGLPLAETVPLFAALLSLPLGADYAPLTVSPEQQKQQTLHALLAILLRIAAQQPVLFVMEDLHWVDPSTLEFLSLVVDQGPTARILALFTFRPDFSPPWTGRSHLTQVTLPRLPRRQAAEMADRVAHGKALPSEVVEQIVAKTDGVPLFVEELTKMVLESGLLQEQEERYALTDPLPPLAIPATLHDSLMARLDRLATIKGLAQLGATLGREFSYELLQAIAPWDEATLRGGLYQLVEAEFLYQQGLPPQATYVFKHALIQDAAYQSLLRSTRQQYHQRIAQVLEVRFPEIAETQPELLAHHYTEAGLAAQAVGYWQQAGQRAHARAAPAEAVVHFTQGLALLPTLPDGPERVQQELTLQLALGPALMVTRGFAAPEVGAAYTRARLLCQQVEETPELFRVLRGLFGFYEVQAQLQTAHELAEQLLHLAQRLQEPALLVEAHRALGDDLFYLGEFAQARQHLEQGLARYEAEQHHGHALLYGQDPGLGCLNYLAVVLWLLGYPEQAQERSRQALALAHQRADPFSLSITRYQAARFHYYRREPQAVREHIEASLALAREQGFPLFEAMGTNLHGWSLTEPSQAEARLAQMHQGLAALKRTGSGLLVIHLARLAEAYGQGGQPGEGLTLVDEALAIGQRTGEQHHAAELQRLKGEILLQTGPRGCEAGDDPSPEAEACFQQALAIARQQQARSWELRAATSLARLWQSQGRGTEAYELLAPVYGWFTEGFDTADLQEAKALLNELT
jgi:TOMM system kinase/cyclase fusion protein